jgi:G:T/U-mismatch repair DNA glycosylase
MTDNLSNTYLAEQDPSTLNDDIERHPLKPFLPENSKVFFLGSFPPQKKRWSMNFYYPNFINDHWRIIGEIFFNDRLHFVDSEHKCFRLDMITDFLKDNPIAYFDSASSVRRLRDNASDKYLEVVEPTNIAKLLERLPHCKFIVCTGDKSATTLTQQLNMEKVPAVGEIIEVPTLTNSAGEKIHLCRLPSSSRAYPLAFHKKAEAYRKLFVMAGML